MKLSHTAVDFVPNFKVFRNVVEFDIFTHCKLILKRDINHKNNGYYDQILSYMYPNINHVCDFLCFNEFHNFISDTM